MTRDKRKEWCVDHAWVSGQDQDGRSVAINIEDKLMAAMAFADSTQVCDVCAARYRNHVTAAQEQGHEPQDTA